MGHESLAECLIPKQRFNPFPKVRYTERPDSAAASIYEGSLLIITDTSPSVMIIPTGVFDFCRTRTISISRALSEAIFE